jgi:L-alanine-DL-glutamate epimerase-like enolase superfamily enzyme
LNTAAITEVRVADFQHAVGLGDDGFFIAVQAGGVTGWYGPVSSAVGTYVGKFLREALVGLSPINHSAVFEQLRRATRAHTGPVSSWAVGAVDCAVWDLHGHLVGLPVAGLLREEPGQVVAGYASWLRLDIASAAGRDHAKRIADEGWAFTKWGLRRDIAYPDEAEARRLSETARHVMDAIGAHAAFDAVSTWDITFTATFADSVASEKLLWLEDPCRGQDIQTYRQVADTGLPLVYGEHLQLSDDLSRLVENVLPVALTLDVVGCGGITRFLDLLPTARAHGLRIYPHGRSLNPAAQLAAAFPDVIAAVEWRVQWEPNRQQLYTDPTIPTNGQLRLPATPGLGTTPRRTP